MPEGATTAQSYSAPITRQQTPRLFERISTPPPSLPSLEASEAFEHRTSTPEPIKVTRAKKKRSDAGKKHTPKPE